MASGALVNGFVIIRWQISSPPPPPPTLCLDPGKVPTAVQFKVAPHLWHIDFSRHHPKQLEFRYVPLMSMYGGFTVSCSLMPTGRRVNTGIEPSTLRLGRSITPIATTASVPPPPPCANQCASVCLKSSRLNLRRTNHMTSQGTTTHTNLIADDVIGIYCIYEYIYTVDIDIEIYTVYISFFIVSRFF